MQIILLYHYFHPDDVISARLFSDLAEELVRSKDDEGKAPRVIAMPSIRSCHEGDASHPKRENWKSVEIWRVWRPNLKQASNKGRIINAIMMLVAWTWRAIITPRSRNEVMIVGTDPTFGVLAAIPWRIFRPRSKIIHWCHDLYPDAAVADGLFQEQSFLVRFLSWWLAIAYRRCDIIADLGICMYQRRLGHDVVSARGKLEADAPLPSNYVELTPWSLVEPATAPSQDLETRRELFGEARLGLLYSGNLGRAHDFERFLKLARRLNVGFQPLEVTNQVGFESLEAPDRESSALPSQPCPAFCFAGRGPRMEELKSMINAGDTNIRFAGFADEAQLEKRLAAADVHLVSLRDEWTGTVVPSKFFGALAAGRAVLFSGSPNSCIAQWIERYQLGWVLTDENIDAVASALIRLEDQPDERQALRTRCHEIYHQHFSKKVQLNRLKDLL